MTDTRRVQIDATVDTTGTRAGFNDISQQANQMATTVAQAGARAGAAVAGVGTGAAGAAQAVDTSQARITQAVQRSTQQIEASERNLVAMTQRTIASLDAGARSGSAFIESLARNRGVDPTRGPLAQYLAQLRQVEQQQTRTGVSAAQTAAAMRQVPAQFTDIVVGLQGGQSPLTVLLQQGGQLRDMFGSAGGAARALGSQVLGLVNPYTVTAGAVAALALAYKAGADEISGFQKALALSNNAAGATADQLSEMARQVGESSGNRGAAAEAITALAASGQVGVENLKQYGALAADVQKIIGRSVEETTEDFTALGKAPLSALDKINEKYHFITAATREQVKALQDQGRQAEAADVAQQAYADGIAEQKQRVLDSLTDWERGWIRIKGAISGAVDGVIDFASGRGDTNAQKINALLSARTGIEQRIEQLKNRGAARDGASYDPSRDANVLAAEAELAANERALNVIRDKDKASRAAAKAKADEQKADEAKTQWNKDEDKYLTRQAQLQRDITKARNEGAVAFANLDPAEREQKINARIAQITKSYADIYNAGIESNIAALKRRDEVADVLQQREMLRIAGQRALGTMTDEEAIGATAKADLAAFDRKQALLEKELVLVKRKANSTKEQADLEGQIAVVGEQRRNREIQQENDLAALAEKRRADSQDLLNRGLLAATAERDSLVEALGAQLDYNAAIGLSKTEQAELAASRLRSAAALKDEKAAAIEAIEPGNAVARMYREQAQALRDTASAKIGGVGRDAAQELKEFLDPTRAQDFGEALRDAFGTAGDSIVKLTGAIKNFGKNQADVDKQRLNAAEAYLAHKKTEEEYLSDLDKLNNRSTKNAMAGYGDMASAAAGFFGEHSRGYQSLMAVSQVFHAAELAMTTAELVPKAISAVLNQGSGDPYTAFGRMAAMAAIVAGLGVAIGGIGGGGADTTAVDRQKANGTGSILGDSDAKSESIKKSLEAIEKNTFQDLAINSSMLTVLRSIDSGINGVSNMLFRTEGFTTNTAGTKLGSAASFATSSTGLDLIYAPVVGPLLDKLTGGLLGKVAGKIGNAIFGGNVTTLDTGITVDKGTLAQLLAGGANVSQYTDTKKDGGLFHSDKYGTTLTDLGAELDKQFTLLFGDMRDAITQSAEVLGIAGGDFTQKLNAFVIDLGKISTKDLKPEEVQQALQNAISKVGDDMAKFAVAGLTDLQHAGEGALETLTRIATEYQTVDVVFASFGKTFGQVGLESVAARDRLVELAGGLEDFSSQGEYFLKNFFSEKEQAAALKARIDPTLATYGLSTKGDDATKAFRDFVVALDTTTKSGAEAYTALMAIAPAFKAVIDAGNDVLDERKDLQDQLDELTLTSAQLLEKQRAALDESNRALFDQIQAIKGQTAAAQAMKDAATALLGGVDSAYSVLEKVVSRERAAVQSSVDAHSAAVTKLQSLSQALHSTFDTIQSPDQKLAARAAGQDQIQAALAIARAGGPLPGADSLKNALAAVQQDASDQFSSYTDYLRDLYTTQNDIGALAGITDDQLSVEEKALQAAKDQLTALDAVLSNAQQQIDEMKGQSTTLLSIADAIRALAGAMQAAQASPVVSARSAINNAYQTYLGRAPDAQGLEWWTNAAANGAPTSQIVDGIKNSTEANLKGLYESVLGRAPDAQGLAFWMNAYGPTMSEAEKADFMKAAQAELQAKANGKQDDFLKSHGVPGYANGGDFAGGIRLVGEIGPEVEATGAARIHSTRALMDALRNPSSNNDVLAAAVERLTATVDRQNAIIEQQGAALDQIQRNTRRQADTLEVVTEGGSAMRTTGGAN